MPHSGPAARHTLSMVLGAILLTAVMLLGLPVAQACGCGGWVAADEDQVQVERAAAAISWDGQNERIVLSMSALAETGEAALLLPTPSPAQVDFAEEGVLAELEQLTAPEVQREYQWWPGAQEQEPGPVETLGDGESVQVLQSVDVGPLQATVLNAGDAGELSQWLDEHGYVMDDALAETVSPYVAEGWYYVAVQLRSDEGTLSGQLPALDITFESSAIIYPMRMSSAASSPQSVRTYVFAEERVTRTDPTGESVPVQVRYAGRPEAGQVQNPTVQEMLQDGEYLTVLDQTFDMPGAQIVSDFVFERSENGGDHRDVVTEVRMREVIGLPAGPVLAVAGLVGAGIVVGLRPWRLFRN